jgi:hypothetical protein
MVNMDFVYTNKKSNNINVTKLKKQSDIKSAN